MRWIQAIACKTCIHKCCSIWCINTTVRTRPADYSWHLCNVCSHMHKGASLPYSLQTGWWWSYLIFVGAVDCGTLGQLLFWHILLYLFKAVFVFARHLEFNLGLLWIAKVHKLLLLLGPGQPSCRQIHGDKGGEYFDQPQYMQMELQTEDWAIPSLSCCRWSHH